MNFVVFARAFKHLPILLMKNLPGKSRGRSGGKRALIAPVNQSLRGNLKKSIWVTFFSATFSLYIPTMVLPDEGKKVTNVMSFKF